MSIVWTFTCDGVLGATALAGDAGIQADAFNGTGTAVYASRASGFTGTGNVLEVDGTGGVKRAAQKSFAAWSQISVDFQIRSPSTPTGGVGVFAYTSVASVRQSRAYLGTGGLPKIAGNAAQDDVDLGVTNLAGGDVYDCRLELDRATSTQWLYIVGAGGYFELLTGGCGNAVGTLLVEIGVAAAAGDCLFQYKNGTVANTLRGDPRSPGLISGPRGTAPMVDGFYVKTETVGASNLQVDVYDVDLDRVAIGSPIFTSAPIAQGPLGWTEILVQDAAIQPNTAYAYQVRGDIGAGVVDLGLPGGFHTLQTPGVAFGVRRIAALGCEKDNKGTRTQTWDHVQTVTKPDVIIQNGDEDYDNYVLNNASKFRQFTSSKLQKTPGMAAVYRKYVQLWRLVSDHDGGFSNGLFFSVGAEAASTAWLDTSGVADMVAPIGGNLWETGKVGSFVDGNVLHIFTDFRTNSRDDPEDPDTPLKRAFHQDQEDWFIATVTAWDAADPRHITMWWSDEPWVGAGSDQIGAETKWDHMAHYPDQRSRYDAAVATCRISGSFGDYHGGAATSRYAAKHPGGMTWFCCNGTTNDSGNVRLPDLHNYEQWYKGEDTTDDGELINLYTEVIITDDGVNPITVQFNGWDANLGTVVMSMTDVFDGTDIPYVPPAPREVLTIDTAPVEVEGETRRAILDMVLGMLPAKDVATSRSRGKDGDVQSNDIDALSTDILLRLGIFAPTAQQKRLATANLYGLFGWKELRQWLWSPDATESPRWAAMAMVQASTTAVDYATGDETITFVAHNPDGRWRSPSHSVTEIMLGSAGFGGTKIMYELSGARAPMDDAILRFTGPLKFINVQDGRTSNGFHWGIPDVDPSLAAGEFLIVDCARRTATVVDHDTWDPTDGGVEHRENFYHWGIGSAPITLVPGMVGGDPTEWTTRIHIDVEDGVDGVTLAEIMVRAATYEPY